MMISHLRSFEAGRALAAPVLAATARASFDAYDYPVIFLAGDSQQSIDLRSVLQSLGFDVLNGRVMGEADEEPLLLVAQGYLASSQNRLRYDRIRARWPQAKVVSVADPTDAVTQLIAALS